MNVGRLLYSYAPFIWLAMWVNLTAERKGPAVVATREHAPAANQSRRFSGTEHQPHLKAA